MTWLLKTTQARATLIVLLISAAAFPLLTMLVPGGFASGDPAVYLQQINERDFSSRSVHLGYYWIGVVFSWLFPNMGDHAFNSMHALLGSLTLAAAGTLAYQLTGKASAALATVLLTCSTFLFLDGATLAEVYLPQTFFLLAALVAWSAERSIVSAVLFSVAFLISPSSVFFFIVFLLIRPNPRSLLTMGLATGLIVALALHGRLDDYLFGARGVLQAADKQLSMKSKIVKEGSEVLKGVGPILPLWLLGCLSAFREKRLQRFGLAVAALWLTTFVVGERIGDVPVQYPTYLLASVLVGVGTAWTIERINSVPRNRFNHSLVAITMMSVTTLFLLVLARGHAPSLQSLSPTLLGSCIGLVGLAAVISWILMTRSKPRASAVFLFATLAVCEALVAVQLVRARNVEIESFRSAVLRVDYQAEAGYGVIASWSPGILFEHYVVGDSYTGLWLDSGALLASETSQDHEYWGNGSDQLRYGREYWLLETLPILAEQIEASGYVLERHGDFTRASPAAPTDIE